MQEIWKDVEGYEGLYRVSNKGRIKSLNYKNTQRIKILKQYESTNGYLRTCLCKNGIAKFFLIHRLVAQAFINNQHNLLEVNHIDGNKQNNNVNNLEWCTRSENNVHAIKNNLRKIKRGKDNPNSKIIYQKDIKTGKILNIFYGIGDIKRKMHLKDAATIGKCCRSVKNYKTAYGYKWEYAERGETNV